jgi:uncharacterized LabA/DUF88 family protein
LADKVAVLLDGGFVKKKLQGQLNRFPATQDVVGLCRELMSRPRLQGRDLFRVFFYDAPPFEGTVVHPLDGSTLNLSQTLQANRNKAFLDALELEPDFAVRRGTLIHTGWKLGKSGFRSLTETPRVLAGQDLVPDIIQKGVDIRIGLDMAWISLKKLVDIVVLVTGDSDFVPAMKFARKEGLRVYLDALGHPVRRELKAHADFVL